jgi:hypothetical protein
MRLLKDVLPRAATAIAATLVAAFVSSSSVDAADDYDRFIGAAPESFATPDLLAQEFAKRLAADDKPGVIALLGLDLTAVAGVDDFNDRFAEIKAAAAERMTLEEDGPDERTVLLGNELWPFPFPLVQQDRQWGFDTVAGVEEVVARRVGENELQAIDTARNYIEAQLAYFDDDWDNDGVNEYAQKLRSTPGTFDGLYWRQENGAPASPAGPYVDDAEMATVTAPDSDYFGYRFRVLTGQGDNVAGDAYDYIINGNMIVGFGLVAWPAVYGESGVKTFVVNRDGAIYEKDLGADTAQAASAMKLFNPDNTWSVVVDDGD